MIYLTHVVHRPRSSFSKIPAHANAAPEVRATSFKFFCEIRLKIFELHGIDLKNKTNISLEDESIDGTWGDGVRTSPIK